MAKSDPKIDRLANVPVFSGCDRKELAVIASIVDEVSVDSGTAIIKQGEHLSFAYVVESGSGRVEIGGEQVGEVHVGEVLGEISMFDPAPAAATIVADTSMSLLVIRHGAFSEIIRSNPDLAISLLRTMAKRFHDATR